MDICSPGSLRNFKSLAQVTTDLDTSRFFFTILPLNRCKLCGFVICITLKTERTRKNCHLWFKIFNSPASITTLGTMAIVFGLQSCRPFLGPSQHVTVYTDHVSATYLQTLKASRGQLYRLALKLGEFQPNIQFFTRKIKYLRRLSFQKRSNPHTHTHQTTCVLI